MKLSIDTKEDSHEELRKVIKMLQNLVGDSQEIFTNIPSSQENASPIANIFGDTSSLQAPASSESAGEAPAQQSEETNESTEDLFAELFSDEELKKMEPDPAREVEEEEHSQKSSPYSIEIY